MLIELKGIAWDHKRGFDPLVSCTNEFRKLNPNIFIHWDKRSLKEFGDFPVSKLAEEYDLLIIDHPFSGEAASKNILENLSSFFSADELIELKENSVGKTFDSYYYDNKLMALPIDAAALVSVVNKRWFDLVGSNIPKTYYDVFALYRSLPKQKKILVSLCATDIWCVFLSLCATSTDGKFINDIYGFDLEVSVKQLDAIKGLCLISDRDPLSLNPIQVLELMGKDDTYIYSPYLFGYVKYSIEGECQNLLHFFDAPIATKGSTSTILGGAGIAISSKSNWKEASAKFVKYVTSPEIQSSLYFESGGQPSHLSAWNSEKINQVSNNFFRNTKSTLTNAYVRPRFPGWNYFQDEGSLLVHDGISKNINSRTIALHLNELFFNHFQVNKS